MFGFIMKQKLKAGAALLCILALLPYIVTVFANGTDPIGGENGDIYVRVENNVQDENGEIVSIPWTEYIAGILAAELPGDFEPETIKAQAVLIRTQLYRSYYEAADIIFREQYMSQEDMELKWGRDEFPSIYEKFISAVMETDDCVLMYQDAFAWTPYHFSSCGRTRNAEEVMKTGDYPYITMKECPTDKAADGEITTAVFAYSEIQNLCRDFLVAVSDGDQAEKGYGYEDFEICEKDEAGYVSRMRIGNTYCSGDQFREAVGLASAAFEFSQEEEDRLKITVTGRGHGLGMSLWTANTMAKEGAEWKEILEFFFEGTQLSKELDEREIF